MPNHLCFSTPNVIAIFRQGPANGGVECRRGRYTWTNSWRSIEAAWRGRHDVRDGVVTSWLSDELTGSPIARDRGAGEIQRGYEKLAFLDQYLVLFRKRYKLRPQTSYNGRPLTADSFAPRFFLRSLAQYKFYLYLLLFC